MTVMSHYPSEILERLIDPFDGLPSRQDKMPTPYDVRKFCDAQVPRPWGLEHARAEAQRAQDEAARSTPRQTLAEIEDEMAARGVLMPGYLKRELRRRVLTWRELEHERYKQSARHPERTGEALSPGDT